MGPESPHTFGVLRGDVVLQVLHTGVLQKFLQFIPSPVVGIELLQGEVDGFGGLLGACHPYGSLRLETYKGTSIHGHIKEDMGFRALLRRQLTAHGAANSQRNYGEGGRVSSVFARDGARCWGTFTRGKGTVEGRRKGCLRTEGKVCLGSAGVRLLEPVLKGATKKAWDCGRKEQRRLVKGSGGVLDKRSKRSSC